MSYNKTYHAVSDNGMAEVTVIGTGDTIVRASYPIDLDPHVALCYVLVCKSDVGQLIGKAIHNPECRGEIRRYAQQMLDICNEVEKGEWQC